MTTKEKILLNLIGLIAMFILVFVGNAFLGFLSKHETATIVVGMIIVSTYGIFKLIEFNVERGLEK